PRRDVRARWRSQLRPQRHRGARHLRALRRGGRAHVHQRPVRERHLVRRQRGRHVRHRLLRLGAHRRRWEPPDDHQPDPGGVAMIPLLWLALTAWASPADDRLALVDAASNRGDDAHIVLAVQTTDRKGESAERTLELWQKGTDKRLARFTEPARLAGVALLVPDGDTVYLYLPSYGRVRRVVGEARGDAFMGIDFTMEDLSRIA